MADQLQVVPDANPESQEYIDKMAALGESAVTGVPPVEVKPAEVPPKPEGIPDKFYNAETGVVDYASLAKSYAELEKKVSQPKAPEPNAGEAPKDDAPPPDQGAAEEAVAKAGLDFSALSQEFAEGGKLTDESYAKLEAAGIPKGIVDQYIAGQQAAVAVAQAEAFAVTGGAEGYKAMVSWAQANMSPEEIAGYNQAVNSPNKGVRDMAVRGLHARYNAESGNEGELLHGGRKNSGGERFESNAQMMAAMADPKYKADPAYRKQVEQKIANSNY